MRRTTIILLAVMSMAARVEAGSGPVWGVDVTNALQNAKAGHRPVLMEFSAPWCPYCRKMESAVFPDPQVTNALGQFERVSVNIDKNAGLAAQHGVRGIPAFVILDSEGIELAKSSGYMEAPDFDKWLAESTANLTITPAQQEEFQTRVKDVEAALAATDTAERARGLEMALECCDRREKVYREFGLEKVQSLADKDPGLLLEGLRSPRLMERIRVANLLREHWGDAFKVDPWEKAETREEGIRQWKEKMASGGK